MKKCVVLLALVLTVIMAVPAAYAGKNNVVGPEWYYNDPDGSAYLYGKLPDFGYVPPERTTRYPYWREDNDSGLGYRTLRKNMRGSDVRTLQTMLKALGYNVGRIDGIFGNRTRSAVRAFQRANLLKIDGIVGPETRTKLLSKYRNRK